MAGPPDQGDARRAALRRGLLLAGALLLAGGAVLPLDLPVSGYCLGLRTDFNSSIHLPGDVRKSARKIVELSEVFGHGLGVLMIVVTLVVLDPAGRVAVPRVLACSLGSGLAASVSKLVLISRTRPSHFDFQGGVLETFNSWVPILTSADLQTALDSSLQGTPSAHAAVAAGLAVALAWRYPRGRWLFVVLAVLAAMQRVLVGAHFPSDTFWGAALGVPVATMCIYGRRLGGWFDRLEQRRA